MHRPRPQDTDTICAQATAYGRGSVAILRVSGPQTLQIVRKVCSFLPEKMESHRIYYGSFVFKKEVIDEVLILFFDKQKSFTSEQVIEICCHANPLICEEILQILQDIGCRIAEKGEFSYRAFMSGRIDLVQAESILQVVEASSLKAKKQALRFLKGGLSHKIKKLKTSIQNLLINIDADIDFSEENLSVISSHQIQKEIQKIAEEIQTMVQGYKTGLYVKEGIRVGLFGTVNVGKSTLFNAFLEEDKAIVSSIEGTTRDQIEGEKFIKGQKLVFIDTAGIRETNNPIEKIGLKKTLQAMEQLGSHFDKGLFIIDGSSKDFNIEEQILQNQKKEILQNIIFIFNKMDLTTKEEILFKLENKNKQLYESVEKTLTFYISAKEKKDIHQIEKFLFEQSQHGEGAIHTQRHYDLLVKVKFYLNQAYDLCQKSSYSEELIAFELKESLKQLQMLIGENVNTDVVNSIFKQFCIGK